MQALPLISVIIPLFNKRDAIRRCLQSVLSQTFQNWEAIVVDDGSTDGSADIVRGITDERITVISQKNGGVSSARNTGAQHAKGQWLALLDADDEFLPDWLKFCSEVIQRAPQARVIAASYEIRGVNSSETVSPWAHAVRTDEHGDLLPSDSEFFSDDFFQMSLQTHPAVCASGICIHTDAFKSTGGFDGRLASGEDLVMWAHLAARHPFVASSRSMVIYHRGPEDSSAWGTWRGPSRHPDWSALRTALEKFVRMTSTGSNGCETRLFYVHLWIDKMLRDDARKALLCGDRWSARDMLTKIEHHTYPKDIVLSLLCWMPASVSLLVRRIRQSIVRKPA